MSDLEVTIDGAVAEVGGDWTLAWLDAEAGIAQLTAGSRSEVCLVEGAGSEWVVTLRGRRIPVAVRSWRDRVLAAAETAAHRDGGIAMIRATLPGLVVAVAVRDGEVVAEGAALLTLEAMKMENEVRAPRAGRVTALSAEVGQPVAAGQLLLRIE